MGLSPRGEELQVSDSNSSATGANIGNFKEFLTESEQCNVATQVK